MASGLKDVSSTIVSRFILMGVGVATQSCLIWFLGVAGRGSYAAMLIFMNILAVVFMVGLDMAGHYHTASGKINPSKSVSTTLFLGLIGSLVGVVVGYGLMQLPIAFFDKATHQVFYLALALLPLHMLNLIIKQLLWSFKDFPRVALAVSLQSLLQLAGIVLFVRILGLGIQGATWGMILATAASIIYQLWVLIRVHSVKLTLPCWVCARFLVSYGFRYYFASISNMADLRIGQILIAMMGTREDLGLFSMATALVGRVTMIPDAITLAIMPRISRDERGRPELAAFSARMVSLITLVLFVALGAILPFIVPILFSEAATPIIPVVYIIMISDVIRNSARPFVPYFNGTNRPAIYSIATILSMLTSFGMMLLLLPPWGLIGASIATACSHLVMGIVLIVLFQKYSGMRFWEVWKYRKDDLVYVKKTISTFLNRK
jgi:O-antigen/teichoic acid export membrane protein